MKRGLRFAAAAVLSVMCALCFAFGVSAIAAQPEEGGAKSLNIHYANLKFEDNVYILYAAGSENIDDTSAIKLLVWESAPAEFTIAGNPDHTLSVYNEQEIEGVTYPIFCYTELAAKQMTDNVYVCAYYDDNGTPVYSEPFKYSILQYAYNMINGGTEDGMLIDLLYSMLSYGSMAQQYFDYNTRNTTMLPKYREYQYEYVRSAIINDLFFNMNSPYNQHANDSLCSTSYSVKDTYHGYNYFEKPFTGNGLLAGLDEPFEASNGYVYKMKDWRIEPSFSFVRPIEIEAENTMRFSVGTSEDSESAKRTKTATVVRTGNTSKYDVSNEAYLIVDDNNQIASRRQPSVTFDIPNILSNIPYDIKVVFATGKAQDINSKDTLNRKVTAQIEMYNTTTSTDFAKPSNLTTNMIVDSKIDG